MKRVSLALRLGSPPLALLLALLTLRCGSAPGDIAATPAATPHDGASSEADGDGLSTAVDASRDGAKRDGASDDDDASDDAAVDSATGPLTDCITFGHVLVGASSSPNATLACTRGSPNPSAGVYPCCRGLTCDSSYGSPLCVAPRGGTCAADAGSFPVCSSRDGCDPGSFECKALTCTPVLRDCFALRLPCCAPGAECKVVGLAGAHECCLPTGAFLSTEPASRGVQCCSRQVVYVGDRQQCL